MAAQLSPGVRTLDTKRQVLRAKARIRPRPSKLPFPRLEIEPQRFNLVGPQNEFQVLTVGQQRPAKAVDRVQKSSDGSTQGFRAG